MKISKSNRHQKIIGAFGEHLVCNWLSRSGFEVTIVDHTGIDLIAYNPLSKRRLGITVKSRTRHLGTETECVNILSYQRKNTDRQKLINACEAFGCEPWIAVYVETTEYADLFLTSLINYDEKYRSKNPVAIDTWKMTETCRNKYKYDADVKHIRISYATQNWEWRTRGVGTFANDSGGDSQFMT